jgi:hypothetical protein
MAPRDEPASPMTPSVLATDASGLGEIRELTAQFYVTLRAYLGRMEIADGTRASRVLERVTELLRPERQATWSAAYEVEQMMVDLFDAETLRAELELRGAEARGVLPPPLVEWYAGEVKTLRGAPEGTVRARRLLARLVNDLQWRYTVNEVKRRYSMDITSRTGQLFGASLALFVLWTALMVAFRPGFGDAAMLVLAALAGGWGASFSMLWSLKRRLERTELDDLKLMRPGVMLLARALIGAGAACIFYFFLRSELLAGTAFPTLRDGAATPDWGKHLAMLIVWCFLAGFSEKFVPGLLRKTEGQSTAAGGGGGRFRPSANGASETMAVGMAGTPIGANGTAHRLTGPDGTGTGMAPAATPAAAVADGGPATRELPG